MILRFILDTVRFGHDRRCESGIEVLAPDRSVHVETLLCTEDPSNVEVEADETVALGWGQTARLLAGCCAT